LQIQYQAVLATTNYFNGAITESTAFYSGVSSLEMSTLGDLPLIVLSHGRLDTISGVDDTQQNQFEQAWSRMQIELAALSSNSKQVIAAKSGHYIQFEQPELVVKSVLELVQERPK
jgi:pimeloyl-ACP methyl ester carboxylesterase